MEIDRFHEVYESSFRDSHLTESAPDYHLIDVESLRQVLRENNHLYADENIRGIVLGIFNQLREIDSQERNYGRVVNGEVDTVYHGNMDSFNQEQQRNLRDEARRLHELFEQLTKQADLEAMAD